MTGFHFANKLQRSTVLSIIPRITAVVGDECLRLAMQ